MSEFKVPFQVPLRSSRIVDDKLEIEKNDFAINELRSQCATLITAKQILENKVNKMEGHIFKYGSLNDSPRPDESVSQATTEWKAMIKSLLEDLKVKISCYSLPPGDTQSVSNQATTEEPQTEEVNLDQEEQKKKEKSDEISVEQAQENIEQSVDNAANSLSDIPSVDTPSILDAPSVSVDPAKSGSKSESFNKIESLAADIMTLIDKNTSLTAALAKALTTKQSCSFQRPSLTSGSTTPFDHISLRHADSFDPTRNAPLGLDNASANEDVTINGAYELWKGKEEMKKRYRKLEEEVEEMKKRVKKG